MRKVLFIVYYFPPMGGSGVQRPLKFARYLPDYNWQPVILAPNAGSYRSFDKSLQQELESLKLPVYRTGADTPFHKFSSFTHKLASMPDFIQQWVRWASQWWYFPDSKKGWIEPAVEMGRQIVENEAPEVIYATAPPFSNLIIGQKLQQETGLPLVLDFRDDWIDSHLQTHPTKKHRKKLVGLERGIISQSEAVIAINRTMLDGIHNRHADLPDLPEFKVITQGFDPADFKNNTAIEKDDNIWPAGKFNMLYSGVFYDSNQPDSFLKAVHQLLESYPQYRGYLLLHFQGRLEHRHHQLINQLNLTELVIDHGYVDHDIAVKNLGLADVLWLIANFEQNNKMVTTGKLFEYLGSSKPILGLVPEDGEAEFILKKYGAGFSAKPQAIGITAEILRQLIEKWKKDNLPVPDHSYVAEFARDSLAGELANVFTRLLD